MMMLMVVVVVMVGLVVMVVVVVEMAVVVVVAVVVVAVSWWEEGKQVLVMWVEKEGWKERRKETEGRKSVGKTDREIDGPKVSPKDRRWDGGRV
jgi:hypothetical protein